MLYHPAKVPAMFLTLLFDSTWAHFDVKDNRLFYVRQVFFQIADYSGSYINTIQGMPMPKSGGHSVVYGSRRLGRKLKILFLGFDIYRS